MDINIVQPLSKRAAKKGIHYAHIHYIAINYIAIHYTDIRESLSVLLTLQFNYLTFILFSPDRTCDVSRIHF
ncbi:Hypothetical predicted protein [Octopus vulgaris]|uniref:Uncharacterized protein n=1 Tax=Octopus vulgaris TaxID=6645 RepID=A0AA36F487_OCTVU|nr:Hypothetical predicted protein [Octopus vulgaris]